MPKVSISKIAKHSSPNIVCYSLAVVSPAPAALSFREAQRHFKHQCFRQRFNDLQADLLWHDALSLKNHERHHDLWYYIITSFHFLLRASEEW